MNINVPDISKLQLDSKKIILIALVAVFIIYADCAFLIKAQLGHLRNLRPKVAKLQKDIKAFNKSFSEMSRFKSEEGEPVVSGKQMIAESDLTDLLEYISDTGNSNNIRITQVKPVREVRAKEEKSPAAGNFIPVYISLDILAGYHNLGTFINILENGDKFIAVQDLRISRDKNDYMRQEVNLTLKTYVKK
ncbi:MAG: type 4a pilus biogenesis protein PilO [Candidatus Omnitrophota bacterium]